MNQPRMIRAAAAAGLALALAGGWAAAAETVYVKVSAVKIRTGTGLTAADSKAAAYARFKDKLTVLGKKDYWLHVETSGGRRGYVDVEDVSEEEPRSKGPGEIDFSKIRGAARSGGTLAARGAFPEVEQAASEHPGDLDTAGVDRMVEFAPTPEELIEFMEKGGLGRRRGEE